MFLSFHPCITQVGAFTYGVVQGFSFLQTVLAVHLE